MKKPKNTIKEVEILDEDLNLETHVTVRVSTIYPENYEHYLGDGVYMEPEY